MPYDELPPLPGISGPYNNLPGLGAPEALVTDRVADAVAAAREALNDLALPCTHIIRSGQLQHAPAVQCGSQWLRWTFVRNRAT